VDNQQSKSNQVVASALAETEEAVCPHGDPECRCGEGRACRHEGRNPKPCTMLGINYHCHVEGCEWRGHYGRCGQAKLGRTWTLCAFSDLRGTLEWRCGAARNLTSDPQKLRVLTEGPVVRGF